MATISEVWSYSPEEIEAILKANNYPVTNDSGFDKTMVLFFLNNKGKLLPTASTRLSKIFTDSKNDHRETSKYLTLTQGDTIFNDINIIGELLTFYKEKSFYVLDRGTQQIRQYTLPQLEEVGSLDIGGGPLLYSDFFIPNGINGNGYLIGNHVMGGHNTMISIIRRSEGLPSLGRPLNLTGDSEVLLNLEDTLVAIDLDLSFNILNPKGDGEYRKKALVVSDLVATATPLRNIVAKINDTDFAIGSSLGVKIFRTGIYNEIVTIPIPATFIYCHGINLYIVNDQEVTVWSITKGRVYSASPLKGVTNLVSNDRYIIFCQGNRIIISDMRDDKIYYRNLPVLESIGKLLIDNDFLIIVSGLGITTYSLPQLDLLASVKSTTIVTGRFF
jgi:hypothetical protein